MTPAQDDPVSPPAPGVGNPPNLPGPQCTEVPAPDPEGHRVDLYLDLGRTLYDAGASVQRISDSVRYCAHALGDDDVHAFVGNEAIEVGRRTGDRTQIRMHAFRNPVRVNATILQGVSRMLASLVTGCVTPEVVRSKLQSLRDQPPAFPAWMTVIAVGAACAAFAWLNNADLVSLWVVFIAASIGFAAKLYAIPRSGNLYLTVLLSALVASVTALVLLPLSHTATAETAGIAALGFSIMLNMPSAALPGCVICGGVARIIKEVAILAGLDPIMSIFVAMAAATLLAFVIGRFTHVTEWSSPLPRVSR